jgi:hypothetical protein
MGLGSHPLVGVVGDIPYAHIPSLVAEFSRSHSEARRGVLGDLGRNLVHEVSDPHGTRTSWTRSRTLAPA